MERINPVARSGAPTFSSRLAFHCRPVDGFASCLRLKEGPDRVGERSNACDDSITSMQSGPEARPQLHKPGGRGQEEASSGPSHCLRIRPGFKCLFKSKGVQGHATDLHVDFYLPGSAPTASGTRVLCMNTTFQVPACLSRKADSSHFRLAMPEASVMVPLLT